MRSILSRLALCGIAGALAISAVGPASAAVHHKRAPQPEAIVSVAPRTDVSNLPGGYRIQNDCISDEGYGRYSSCDQGGF
jgi:hypothetical protein